MPEKTPRVANSTTSAPWSRCRLPPRARSRPYSEPLVHGRTNGGEQHQGPRAQHQQEHDFDSDGNPGNDLLKLSDEPIHGNDADAREGTKQRRQGALALSRKEKAGEIGGVPVLE